MKTDSQKFSRVRGMHFKGTALFAALFLLSILCTGILSGESASALISPMKLLERISSNSERHESENENEKAGWMHNSKEDEPEDKTDSSGGQQSAPDTAVTSSVPAAVESEAQNVEKLRMTACLASEATIQKKITTLQQMTQAHERKLTNLLDEVIRFQKSHALRSREVTTLTETAQTIRETQVEPLVSSLQEYQIKKPLVCSIGVDALIERLIEVQTMAVQSQDSLNDYRNSIKAMLFSVREQAIGRKQ